MKLKFAAFFFLISNSFWSQIDISKALADCNLNGSITIYDYNNKKWMFSDEKDAEVQTLPASTFKIINSLIALEEKVLKDENEIWKWDSVKRWREEWNADTDLKNAYKNSTVWFYQKIAREVGEKKYEKYIDTCNYGNKNLDSGVDVFWLDNTLKISPKNQIEFLIKLHEEKLPFSKRNFGIVKKIMINEENESYTLRAKTGWGVTKTKDIGWWVGYVQTKDNIFFFATRLWKLKEITNDNFLNCRKEITYKALKQLNIIK